MNLYEEIKSNLKETNTKAGNSMEEICAYIYNDCGGDINNFPDKEQMEYIADVTGREYNKIKEMVETAINNVSNSFYGDKIEISDKPTKQYIYIENINTDNLTDNDYLLIDEHFQNLVDSALKDLEKYTNGEVYQDGRNGRHIVMEDNFYNAYHYDEIKEKQEELENGILEQLNLDMQEQFKDIGEDN